MIPSASETREKVITSTVTEDIKSNTNLSNSPPYVILDDDSNPATPMTDEKLQRTTSIKKTKESSTITPTVDKRARESESSSKKDKISGESIEKKSSRTIDGEHSSIRFLLHYDHLLRSGPISRNFKEPSIFKQINQ